LSILVIDKPCGPSSFGVVKRVRALLGKKRERVGHGGTLDPFASGVLPLCVGEGTKVLPFLLGADKSYEALIRFGVETDTLDVTGTVIAEHPVADLTRQGLEAGLDSFRGTIEQVPPMYSALKRDGMPLYKYARAGITVERQPRKVTIHSLDLLDFDGVDRARLRIHCSKGTYIRALAADLGRQLGVGGHLVELRRTASGPFRIEQAVTLDALASLVAEGRPLPMITPLQALAHLPAVSVDDAGARVLRFGQRMDWQSFAGERPLSGAVCAVAESPEGPVLVAVVAQGPDGTVKILRGFSGSVPDQRVPQRSCAK
jgi:tRNA pseudouridine55 synthase